LTLPSFNNPSTLLNKGKLTTSSENDKKLQNKEMITFNNSASRGYKKEDNQYTK